MRWRNSRSSDNTFDLNLAPVLDIIVSIVPMLLLSVAFLEVKMIETPVPQVVEKAIENLEKNNEGVEITLHLSKKKGYEFEVSDRGNRKTLPVQLKDGTFDFSALRLTAMDLKQNYPTVFNLAVAPESDVSLNEIIASLDQVRRSGEGGKTVQVKDPESGELITTDLMFPKVSFANVTGE